MAKDPVGTCVRITGGLLADPEGNGIGYDTPGPIPKKLKGMLGQLVAFDPVHGLNIPAANPYPFEPYRSQIMAQTAREVADGLTVVEVIDGPLAGTLLNKDLLEVTVVSPLELLAMQAAGDRPEACH